MKTRVVILAQGEQSRLRHLPLAKQLLPLPACDNTPILDRTIRQVFDVLAAAQDVFTIDVVSHPALCQRYLMHSVKVSVPPSARALSKGSFWRCTPGTLTLMHPGNSSLKGIAEYLIQVAPARAGDERTVVLLGDVVYSWDCIRALLGRSPSIRFVGTSDLSRSGGELWGLAWHREFEETMQRTLADALRSHTPHSIYQPGQMRRWYWALVALLKKGGDCVSPWPFYVAIDDYTRDIDVQEHVDAIPALSLSARDDDCQNGVVWDGVPAVGALPS